MILMKRKTGLERVREEGENQGEGFLMTYH